MSVTSVDKDFDNLTITVIADFDASVEQVWQLWADPRKLERWWGPPSYPATVQDHDLTPGGTVTYFMTSPEGEKYHGWWRINAVNPPTSLEIIDGFAHPDGTPNTEMPISTMTMRLTEHDGRTRMEIRSVHDTREQMDKLIEMGALEGMRAAVNQIDDLLAA